MRTFFSKKNEGCPDNTLLLFFNGWGMDEKPFLSLLPENQDCLIISDYQKNDDPKIVNYLSPYKNIVLISWSMGVWYGQTFFSTHKQLKKRITFALAVNGTLDPINTTYGINPELFESMALDYSVAIRDRFYRQMCGRDFKRFMDNKPERDLVNQQLELKRIISIVKPVNIEDSIYHRALISNKDFIVPTNSQTQFWKMRNNSVIKGSHFPFYSWNDLSICVEESRDSGSQQ